MSLRDDDVMLADFVDAMRAAGFEVSLKHYRYADGRELGKPQSLPPGWIEIPVGPGTASEAAAYFGGKRK